MRQLRLPLGDTPRWMDTTLPRWKRVRLMLAEADKVADSKIVYRSGEYGPSLKRANAAKDAFAKEGFAAIFQN